MLDGSRVNGINGDRLLYIRFWFPDSSPLLSGILVLSVLVVVNIVAVRWFGELESFFLRSRFLGSSYLFCWVSVSASGIFRHLIYWSQGEFLTIHSFFPFGLTGIATSFRWYYLAFAGVEMID